MHMFFSDFTNYRKNEYWPLLRAYIFRFAHIDWSNKSYFEFTWKYTLMY